MCASILLLATTNKLCLDVAVIPFLWVLPLALYLLSFVICFDHPRWYRRFPFALVLLVALSGLCWAIREHDLSIGKLVIVYSFPLFVCCLVCHGELYRLKPDPQYLTGFYLMIAAGGALGGTFVTVIAPMIFAGYHELYIGALLCMLLFLGACFADPRHCRRSAVALLAVAVLLLAVAFWFRQEKFGDRLVYASRNFYGVLRVFDHSQGDPPEHILWVSHGQTLHGAQFLDRQKASLPTIYYGEESGAGLAMRALPKNEKRIGLVGLGAGTLVTYAQSGDYVHIYEINPEMQRIATSEFSYLSNCPAMLEVTLGDARLSLERESPQNFDLLALDAFSSDAIPVHLLTTEAFEVYDRHLKTNGIIAVHISNKWLDLEPVLVNVARRFNYKLVVIDHLPSNEQWWLRHSVWVLLARGDELVNSPVIRAASRPAKEIPANISAWTDDFSSLFRILQ
jgi:spermidine synthase